MELVQQVQISTARRKWGINGRFCKGLELIGSTTIHLHGLPGKKQTDVSMEVDLPRFGALEPQMNEVAQGATLAQGQGLPAGLIIWIPTNWNRKCPLAEKSLMSCWHGS